MIEGQKRLWIGVDGHGTWLKPITQFHSTPLNDGELTDEHVAILRDRNKFQEAFSKNAKIIPFAGPSPSLLSHIKNLLDLTDRNPDHLLADDRLYRYYFDWNETKGAADLAALPDDQVRITFQSAMLARLEPWLRGRFVHPSVGDHPMYPNRWQYLYQEVPAILRSDASVSPVVAKAFETGYIYHAAREEYRQTSVNREVRVVEDTVSAADKLSRIFEITVHVPITEEEARSQPKIPLPPSLRRGYDDIRFAPHSLLFNDSGMQSIADELKGGVSENPEYYAVTG